MSALDSLKALLQDPPPEFAFEISASGIAMSRTRPPATVVYTELPPGVLEPSPVKDNMLDPAAFAHAVSRLVPAGKRGGRRGAALILPDNALRLAVLDFENLPQKDEERQALIRFRLKKTLPFDVDEAALSWHIQPGNKVVAAVAPADIIVRYETASGLWGCIRAWLPARLWRCWICCRRPASFWRRTKPQVRLPCWRFGGDSDSGAYAGTDSRYYGPNGRDLRRYLSDAGLSGRPDGRAA